MTITEVEVILLVKLPQVGESLVESSAFEFPSVFVQRSDSGSLLRSRYFARFAHLMSLGVNLSSRRSYISL